MRRAMMILTGLLILSGCSGTLGDTLGGILGSPSADSPSNVTGVVDSIDTRAQQIFLDTRYVNNLRNEQQNQSVYYDSNTRVVYQGRDFAVDQLERGDEVSIHGANNGGRYVADTITVTDRKSTRLNSSHVSESRMPFSA